MIKGKGMSEIKAGLWQNIFNGSYINVRRGNSIEPSDVLYSEEGCGIVHRMSVKELTDSYELRESNKPAPSVDDTSNDDTPAQTFGELNNAKSVVCQNCNKKFQCYHNRVSIRRSGMCGICRATNTALEKSDDTFNDDTHEQTFGSLDTRYSRIKRDASKMRLIGIAGPARAGKDTLASYMLDSLDGTWSRSSFADPIKEMLRAIGVDCSDDAKAVVSDDYGVTPRHMMQTLGTEWGRHMIDGDIWVKAFARLNAGKCVIVPDVRFENEAALVREHGVLIHLVGRGGIEGKHVSENAIEFKPGDIVIDNSRDLAWLHGQVDGNAALNVFIEGVGL